MRTQKVRVRLFIAALNGAIGFMLSLAPPGYPVTGTGATATQSPPYLATANSSRRPASPQTFTPTGISVFSFQRSALAAPLPTNSSGSVYYRQTGHYLKDAFLNYWLMNGGLALYGYPITEEFVQDGIAVQYFERSRFEYNPASSRPWKVELTNVGSLITEGRTFQPAGQTHSTEERDFFPETGHTLGGAFRQFWRAGGGLPVFGYPISEELQEQGMVVQYFERARFELPAQGRVQVGRLGAELLARYLAEGRVSPDVAAPLPRPGFNMAFRGEATVFSADWNRLINLNKSWGNLPQDFVGRGLYAAAPADLYLYGRWARVTRGNRAVFVQFVDVINWPDIPYVRSRGIVIDLGQEAFRALGGYSGGRYEVNFEVFWPGEGPDN
jgi:hypothetical protein